MIEDTEKSWAGVPICLSDDLIRCRQHVITNAPNSLEEVRLYCEKCGVLVAKTTDVTNSDSLSEWFQSPEVRKLWRDHEKS